MKGITPCIWFDQNALEAVELYTSLFENSRIDIINYYYDGLFPEDFEGEKMPEGTVLDISFELCGQKFAAVNGGSIFRPNPAVSLYVVCQSIEQINELHDKLLPGGFELMELNEYPFAGWYCWLEDRFGVSWQLILATGEEDLNPISPCMLFVGEVNGKAEEAMAFYGSVFEDSRINNVSYYGKNEGGDEGTVSHAEFRLGTESFIATDSSYGHNFHFNEGLSFMVSCQTQEEIDYYWDKLIKQGQEQPCGWLKDAYGLSWQIVPDKMNELADQSDRERAARVNKALMSMTKINIRALEDAYNISG